MAGKPCAHPVLRPDRKGDAGNRSFKDESRRDLRSGRARLNNEQLLKGLRILFERDDGIPFNQRNRAVAALDDDTVTVPFEDRSRSGEGTAVRG